MVLLRDERAHLGARLGPGATLSLRMRSRIFGSRRSATSPTVTSTEIAMQRSPAEP